MQTCMSKNAVNCNSVTVELPSYITCTGIGGGGGTVIEIISQI